MLSAYRREVILPIIKEWLKERPSAIPALALADSQGNGG